MREVDWVNLSQSVALEILGEPKSKTSTHWRWGNKGSLALAVSGEGEGTFYDFENDEGYTCHQFILKHGRDLQATLKAHGYSSHGQDADNPLISKTPKSASRSFNRMQMQELFYDALIKVQYSETFWVMRFPENHRITTGAQSLFSIRQLILDYMFIRGILLLLRFSKKKLRTLKGGSRRRITGQLRLLRIYI